MMDRYTKGLWSGEQPRLLQFNGIKRPSYRSKPKHDLGYPRENHDDHERSECVLRPRTDWLGLGPEVDTHGFGLRHQVGQLSQMFLHRIVGHGVFSRPRYFKAPPTDGLVHKALK